MDSGPPAIVIVVAGDPVPASAVVDLPATACVIAVDGGIDLAHDLGWDVDHAIGDMDSVSMMGLARAEAFGATIHRHPRAKEATDLELALDLAVVVAGASSRDAAASTVVVGGAGGRPDHDLANLLVLAAERYAPLDLERRSAAGTVVVVRAGRRFVRALTPGATFSVIPAHGAATVSVTGARWPLDHEVLIAGSTRGVSNEAAACADAACPDAGLVGVDVHAGVAYVVFPEPTIDLAH